MRRALAVLVVLVVLGGFAVVRWQDRRSGDAVEGPGAATLPTAGTGFVAPTAPGRVLLEGFDEIAITVRPAAEGDPVSWCMLAALTEEQRGRGLMEVTDLQGYAGMVFVYPQDVGNAFYMRNTPTPLSIAWVTADGAIVNTTDMAPCEDRDDCPTYPPGGGYRYAVETFQGDLPSLGITKGATVTVGGPCAPA
jgi:uncharacterized membrane protein (UPF0127 family)